MQAIIIVLIIILILLLVLLYCKIKMSVVLQENFEYPLGYANMTDPYDKPFIIKGFLLPFYCQQIISNAQDKLTDSEVIGGKHPDIRNSQQCWLSKTDPLIRPLFEKISNLFEIPFENAEDLQVVRYLPGQYFNEHHDSCCDGVDKCKEFVARGGQRKLTVLIYLNNEFEGGHTYFRNLDLKLKPATGDAIVFYPLAKGTCFCHPLALHAGMPVDSGIKWVANLWFREKEFKY